MNSGWGPGFEKRQAGPDPTPHPAAHWAHWETYRTVPPTLTLPLPSWHTRQIFSALLEVLALLQAISRFSHVLKIFRKIPSVFLKYKEELELRLEVSAIIQGLECYRVPVFSMVTFIDLRRSTNGTLVHNNQLRNTKEQQQQQKIYWDISVEIKRNRSSCENPVLAKEEPQEVSWI